ncbi:hypothetical protein [Rhodococcus sp. NPDC127528]|uniref:hypothetical protein n=1 Tax=unclassified Rhodococcus (in: high G+C Gram-positive bacteria) TaxID=192944 RepID=UPI003632F3AB
MADYQITPYKVYVTPAGDPSSPHRMGEVSPGTNISALEAVTNTLVALSLEETPRKRSDDRTRHLDVQSVTTVEHQVEAGCLLGVSGYTSKLSLEALDVPAVREHSDAEWFDLRVLFAASPSARAGILLVESVGNFGIGKHVGDLLRQSIRASVDSGIIVRIDPIQEALTLGKQITELQTQSIEFRTLIKSSDKSQNAKKGGKEIPYSKVIKIQRRGGLGSFSKFKGKTPSELVAAYGFMSNDEIRDDTTATASVVMPSGRPRKVNVEEGTPSSISFPIDRETPLRPPTASEFYKTATSIVDEVRQGVGLGALKVVDQSGNDNVVSVDNLQAKWTVCDETPTS